MTDTFTAALDAAFGIQPDHPGANHFYIHAVESVHPERGVPMAERLETLLSGAGHLVHMPSHIYVRIGRYHDAVRTNWLWLPTKPTLRKRRHDVLRKEPHQ